MAHDSYFCENPYLLQVSLLQVFPFPTKRTGRAFVGEIGRNTDPALPCPEACRPTEHKDWEYC